MENEPQQKGGGRNLDRRFGAPKWEFVIAEKDCLLVLTFPEGPIGSEEAAKFQMNAMNGIIKAYNKNCVSLGKIMVKLYSKKCKKLEGVAIINETDDKIHWKSK